MENKTLYLLKPKFNISEVTIFKCEKETRNKI